MGHVHNAERPIAAVCDLPVEVSEMPEGRSAALRLVEAAITAAKAGNIAPDQVTVHGHSGWRNSMHGLDPKDFPRAIHSLSYNMAAAVADRDFTWRHVSMEKINDPAIRLLQEKVRLKLVPRQHDAVLRGSTVTITTKSGKEYSGTVEWPKGSRLPAELGGPMWTLNIGHCSLIRSCR
jgi:2-methylcitrate dehydratase PrpD